MKHDRDLSAELLARFTDTVLDDVARRARLTNAPDGYGTGSRGQVGHSTDPTSTTERAVLARNGGHVEFDVIQRSCEQVHENLAEARRALARAARAWQVIAHAGDAIRGRQVGLGTCQACGRNDVTGVGSDRLKSGYCPACYEAWRRTGTGGERRMDRLTFERSRRTVRDVAESGYRANSTSPRSSRVATR